MGNWLPILLRLAHSVLKVVNGILNWLSLWEQSAWYPSSKQLRFPHSFEQVAAHFRLLFTSLSTQIVIVTGGVIVRCELVLDLYLMSMLLWVYLWDYKFLVEFEGISQRVALNFLVVHVLLLMLASSNTGVVQGGELRGFVDFGLHLLQLTHALVCHHVVVCVETWYSVAWSHH